MTKQFSKKKSFALIYTLLFIVLLVITVLATTSTSLLDIKLQRRNESSNIAYQLAKIAVDDGWNKYSDSINIMGTTVPIVQYPAGIPNGCTLGNPAVMRVYINSDPQVPNEVKTRQAGSQSEDRNYYDQMSNGFYSYRMCAPNSSIPDNNEIEGIGYYRGIKYTLKGVVKHSDETICTNPLDPSTCYINHQNDTINIYQAGPS